MARTIVQSTSGIRSCESDNGKAAVRAVVFDMDGVIIDSHPAHRKAWRKFLQSMGRDVSDSELNFVLDGRKRSEILRHFLGNLSEAELEEKGKAKDQVFHDLESQVKPIRGVIEFMNSLRSRSIAIALATSASESRARSTLDRLGVSDLFQAIITGADVPKGKPDPAIYQITCIRLQLEPKNMIAIEDAISGVRAATRAGIRCIGVTGHESSSELITAGADFVIQDFHGISKEKLELMLEV